MDCRLVAYLQSCLLRTVSSNSASLHSMHGLFSSFAGMMTAAKVSSRLDIEKKVDQSRKLKNSGGA